MQYIKIREKGFKYKHISTYAPRIEGPYTKPT